MLKCTCSTHLWWPKMKQHLSHKRFPRNCSEMASCCHLWSVYENEWGSSNIAAQWRLNTTLHTVVHLFLMVWISMSRDEHIWPTPTTCASFLKTLAMVPFGLSLHHKVSAKYLHTDSQLSFLLSVNKCRANCVEHRSPLTFCVLHWLSQLSVFKKKMKI